MLNHPIAINTTIKARQPQCPCKGSAFKEVTGQILKVITNHSGTWYYLNTGVTVKSTDVVSIEHNLK